MDLFLASDAFFTTGRQSFKLGMGNQNTRFVRCAEVELETVI